MLNPIAITITLISLVSASYAVASVPNESDKPSNVAANNIAQVNIESARHRFLSGNKQNELDGHYKMENGDTLIFTHWQNRFYAETKNIERTEVKSIAQNTFAAKDQSIILKFNPDSNESDTSLRVQYTVAKK
jgi:hypothetical protein